MNPGGRRGGKSSAPGGSVLRPGKTLKFNGAAPDGTVKKNPWKGIPAGDRQGMKEAIALRYGKPDPAVDAVRAKQAAAKPRKTVTKEEGRHLFGVGKDSAFQGVAALKGTRPFMGGTFVPDKMMTVARRRRLGIKPFSTRAESPTMYAERVPGGWAIGKRSGR